MVETPIRVLYLEEIAEIAGIANSLISLINSLDRARFEPVVACPEGDLAAAMHQLGVEHVPYSFRMRRLKIAMPAAFTPRPVNLLALLQKAREGIAIAQIIKERQINIVHTTSLSAHIAGLMGSRLAHVPVLWHIHLFYPRLLYRFALPDRLVFVSQALLKDAFPGETIPDRAQVIYNGEDFSHFDPSGSHHDLRTQFGFSPGQPIVAIVAQLRPLKGHQELLHAWKQVVARCPEARLLIVGDEVVSHGQQGLYRAKLQRLAEELAIADSVTFTGFRRDITDILYSIDILVSASYIETSSRSVLEAMAMEKAIVATHVGGVPELVSHNETALLIPPHDIPALASAIIRLIEDPELRKEMGINARQQALRRFSIQEHISKVQNLYLQLAPRT